MNPFAICSLVFGPEKEIKTKEKGKVRGRWGVEIGTMVWSSIFKRCLQNFLHVPDFEYSLISVSSRDKKFVFTPFVNDSCGILKGGRYI